MSGLSIQQFPEVIKMEIEDKAHEIKEEAERALNFYQKRLEIMVFPGQRLRLRYWIRIQKLIHQNLEFISTKTKTFLMHLNFLFTKMVHWLFQKMRFASGFKKMKIRLVSSTRKCRIIALPSLLYQLS